MQAARRGDQNERWWAKDERQKKKERNQCGGEGEKEKKDKSVERDKESVEDLGSSNGHLVGLPHEGVLWQAVCAAVKQNQRSPSVWKQDL